MASLRWIPLAASLACSVSCSTVAHVKVAKTRRLCEVHKVPVTERPMPQTPLKGIEDNGYHREAQPYYDASESRFPYVGTNLPSCGDHGGQLFWICPDCVKAETAWIRRNPKRIYPVYPEPDPRK